MGPLPYNDGSGGRVELQANIPDIGTKPTCANALEPLQLACESQEGLNLGLGLEGLDLHRPLGLNNLLIGRCLGKTDVRGDLIVGSVDCCQCGLDLRRGVDPCDQ